MKKYIIYIVLIIIVIFSVYYVWNVYRAKKLISGLDMNVSLVYKSDLNKYNQAINNDDISYCLTINNLAIFNNGENIKIRCEDSIYFNKAFQTKDKNYCEKMSSDSPMKLNCFKIAS